MKSIHVTYESQATLKQIAKELNVSVSTVSKALNDSPEISDQTKLESRNMQS
jgi:DNA-directed RNA polymerase specialized sigma subunit